MNRSPAYWAQGALFVIAAFLLGQWAEVEIGARTYQARASTAIERWPGSTVSATAAGPRAARARAEARRTGIVGRLEIPRLGLSAMVGEGIDDRTLDRAIGHLPESAFPGEPGNVALAGHRDTFLRKLERIEKGDRIEIQTADGSFSYVVVSTGIHEPTAVHLIEDTETPFLTIVTCYPFRAIGPAPRRFVVQAVPVPTSDPRRT